MDIRSVIARRSVRTFEASPIPRSTVALIIDQARWTGSARNRQPWRFVAVYDQGIRSQLAGLGAYAGHLEAAPVVLVLLSPVAQQLDTEFDLGRVAQSITLVAAELGLGSCITSLYPEANSRIAADLVSADPGWAARHAIALGVPAPKPTVGRSAIPLGRRSVAESLRFL
ncbi:nitroreductase family protein [Herbiconiux ginsengi]|uniref:Nitroreductase n=1 Tax=Herbiconiux ginsengi TaxID=381665 RepID=A0A1H3S3G7_9MICO|nr:nitroreductase family protein [Herbiconiux ginsengi]SDZ32307.1 Nitroreductase [Herbiconiux ginsengi]